MNSYIDRLIANAPLVKNPALINNPQELDKAIQEFKAKELYIFINLILFTKLIDMISYTHVFQTSDSPMLIFNDVLNPEKNRIKAELISHGIETYICAHGQQYGIHQICACREKGLFIDTNPHFKNHVKS